MQCPNCNETLVMSDRQGIEIDYCPKCRGVWLDRGELDKIIERSNTTSAVAPPPVQEPYREKKQEHYYHELDKYHPYKKKKGFLGDLFDFD